MSDFIDINEGQTGANGVPASIVGLIGLVLLTINFWISLLFFGICVVMASMTEGIEFDRPNKKYRKYYALFSLKSGSWKKLPAANGVALIMNIRSFSVTRWLPSSVRSSGSVRERILTFNIILESFNGQELLYEFYNYNHAKLALEAIGSILDVPSQDHVEVKINERN